jgi:hypothetical protein
LRVVHDEKGAGSCFSSIQTMLLVFCARVKRSCLGAIFAGIVLCIINLAC